MKERVLISAFACDPCTGSEPYVGWNWARTLSDDVEVHVLTRAYSKHLIEGHRDCKNIRFHYFDFPGAETKDHYWRFIKPYYILWQFAVLFKVLLLNRNLSFSIVHHLTYNNVDIPGFLWLVRGPSFVWGPVGGGQVPPKSLSKVFGSAWTRQRYRAFLKKCARYNPLVVFALLTAKHVWFANEETRDLVSGVSQHRGLMLETAIEVPPISSRTKVSQSSCRILWLSNIIPRKGLMIGLDAFARAVRSKCFPSDVIVDIVGDGASAAEMKLRAEALGLADRVKFHGSVPHAKVANFMDECDIFLFTSVQDTSGNVVLEAMSHGKPVIALDHQGAKAIVRGGGGLLVSIGSYEDTVTAFSEAIIELVRNPQRRLAMGDLARIEIARFHTWESRRLEAIGVYKSILDSRRAK